MDINFKVTMWESIDISEHPQQAEILKAIKNGKITSGNDLFEQFPHDDLTCDTLYDTSEQMSKEDNKGGFTIEVMDADRNILLTN